MQIQFNSKDFGNMLTLMDEAEKFTEMCSGVNEQGEKVLISINPTNITVNTFQDNGWNRINVYWRDGRTEELFDGKWR